MIQTLVIGLELLVLGLFALVVVYIISSKQPRRGSRNSFLYILVMSLIFYAIFYLKDPLDFIPQEIWNVANYLIIVITIYGFYHQLTSGLRLEFNDRLSDFRTELRRDIDRIEKRLDKIDGILEKLSH